MVVAEEAVVVVLVLVFVPVAAVVVVFEAVEAAAVVAGSQAHTCTGLGDVGSRAWGAFCHTHTVGQSDKDKEDIA